MPEDIDFKVKPQLRKQEEQTVTPSLSASTNTATNGDGSTKLRHAHESNPGQNRLILQLINDTCSPAQVI
jgi:hypothetical protein